MLKSKSTSQSAAPPDGRTPRPSTSAKLRTWIGVTAFGAAPAGCLTEVLWGPWELPAVGVSLLFALTVALQWLAVATSCLAWRDNDAVGRALNGLSLTGAGCVLVLLAMWA